MSTPSPATSARTPPAAVAGGDWFFMQTLDATIVNTALPAMAQSLGESPLQMQSVIVAYCWPWPCSSRRRAGWPTVLACAQVYWAPSWRFVLGSVLCALAATLEWLVAARVLQGWGGALLLPVGGWRRCAAFLRRNFCTPWAW